MTEEQKQRLEKLREKQHRKSLQDALDLKLKHLIPHKSYSFLSQDYSNTFQNQTDPWPKLKWENKLYVQTEMSNPGIITSIVDRFIKLNPFDYTYVFFMNFHFGLVKIDNDVMVANWPLLVEADGDDILCLFPHRTDYICIERLEEQLVGKEQLGYTWLYELTFSNEIIKSELLTEGA
jgi:hypothetical protein